MQVSITGRHLDLTDEHKSYLEKRLWNLKPYFESIMDCHVVLAKEKHRELAEITIIANGVTMHGEEETGDIFASIDKVVDKIDRQLRKHKEKLKKRYRGRGAGPDTSIRYKMDVLSGVDMESGHEEPRVIRTKTLALKPLSIDEAVMQMDLLNQDFLVYRNASTDRVNVIYRRPDGNFNLVVPEEE